MSLDSPRRARSRVAALVALAAVPVFAATAAAAPLPVPGPAVWSGDWETGSTSQWSGCQASASYSIQVDGSNVREGAYAARFEVRDGDNPIGSGERSECQRSSGEVEGSERWYSWSTYFAPDFPTGNATGGWATFTQWHANASTGSPPVGMYLEGGRMVLKLHRQSSPASYVGIITPWGTDFASNRGRWIDFTMRVKWSGSDSVGWVELWMDGVKQRMNWPGGGNAAAHGGLGSYRVSARTLVPGYGAYVKQGFYRCECLSGTAVVLHDGLTTADASGDGEPSETASPPPSAVVSLAPASATLAPGATQQFTAGGRAVTWSVDGVGGGNAAVGTVTASGLYTAPAVAPAAPVTVTATSTGSTAPRASATVTVTSPAPARVPAPAPIPPPPSAGTLLFADGFEGSIPAGAPGSPWRGHAAPGGSYGVATRPVAAGARALDVRTAGSGNAVYVSRGFANAPSATLTMRVHLRDAVLATGGTTVIARMLSGHGSSPRSPRFEVGLRRTSDGRLHWSVWGMTDRRAFSAAVLSPAAPAMNRWYTLRLSTDWDSASARARLRVDDGTDLTTPAVDMAGHRANGVEVGVPWTNAGNRLRVGLDEIRIATGGTSAAARSRTRQRHATVRIPAYRAMPAAARPRTAGVR